MKRIVTALTVVAMMLLFAALLQAQPRDRFERTAIIPAEANDIGGFGNIVAGVDFDNDGKLEIYTVNNDWHDAAGKDLVPRMYKYEKDANGEWAIVWMTRLAFDFQNTWPAFAAADLDKDGKSEIVWGPVNNLGGGTNPNPSRIVVFETAGDGSDNMGVDNGDGTWKPNAEWTITTNDNEELRPFRWQIQDIDGDGVDEIVTGARRGDGIQIYSTSDVPDAADGSETWTLEFSGVSGTFYDMAVIDSTVYGIQSNGDVTPVTWSAAGDSFRIGAKQVGIVGKGSWKSAAVIDADGDGAKEIIVASWNSATSNVYLLQPDADSLKSTIIKDVPDASFRLYGGAAGDADGDGMVDFMFGTRQSTPNGIIHRLEYNGGPVDSDASWDLTIADMGVSRALQYDVTVMADVNGDGNDELLYSGVPRGLGSTDAPQPLVILNYEPNVPVVQAVVDVENDNGRQVRVDWAAAKDDYMAGGAVITEYTIWRKVDAGSAGPNMFGGKFEQVGTSAALQKGAYSLTVPTLKDAIDGGDPAISVFVVVAHTADVLTHWNSLPNGGASVDNLIPTAPSNLIASEDETAGEAPLVRLAWDDSPDEDFDYFMVVRGTEAGFDPATAEVIGTTTSPEFVDNSVAVGQTFFYRVVAFDFNKNQGEFSDEVSLMVTSVNGSAGSAIPESFALQQNYPNPFNPTTQITYDLPQNTSVVLKIYNMKGQEVRTLVDENKVAGSHAIQWNGRSNNGSRVASGIYVYVLRAGDFVQSKRMTLLK